uniref:Uncharacterized protein n=1 Tax=Caenorhabditis tropicalis TaxID=1561998 RepID=A0A1I7TRJ0_9PELO
MVGRCLGTMNEIEPSAYPLFINTDYIHFPVPGAIRHYVPLLDPKEKTKEPGLLTLANPDFQVKQGVIFEKPKRQYKPKQKKVNSEPPRPKRKYTKRKPAEKTMIGGGDFSFVFKYYDKVMETRRKNGTDSESFPYIPRDPNKPRYRTKRVTFSDKVIKGIDPLGTL